MTARLDASSWMINGESVTAWISDLEVFEIRPAHLYPIEHPPYDGWSLTLSHVGDGQTVFLGFHEWLADAQRAACRHIGDERPADLS